MNLNVLYRYQDDCIALEDNSTFREFVSDIYPEEMEVENTNVSPYSSTYLDLHIIVYRGKYNFSNLSLLLTGKAFVFISNANKT